MLIASQHKKKDKMLHEKTLRSSLRKAYELPFKKKKERKMVSAWIHISEHQVVQPKCI